MELVCREHTRNLSGAYKDFHMEKLGSRQAPARLSLAERRRRRRRRIMIITIIVIIIRRRSVHIKGHT